MFFVKSRNRFVSPEAKQSAKPPEKCLSNFCSLVLNDRPETESYASISHLGNREEKLYGFVEVSKASFTPKFQELLLPLFELVHAPLLENVVGNTHLVALYSTWVWF